MFVWLGARLKKDPENLFVFLFFENVSKSWLTFCDSQSETFTRSELSVETPTFDENLLFVSFKFLVLFGNKSV
jgi:hypothetical protein